MLLESVHRKAVVTCMSSDAMLADKPCHLLYLACISGKQSSITYDLDFIIYFTVFLFACICCTMIIMLTVLFPMRTFAPQSHIS